MIIGNTTYKELAIFQLMETHSTGQILFEKVKGYFEINKIPIKNLIVVATDGAPSMIGYHRGLITYFKQLNSKVFTMHCVIHGQHLVVYKFSTRLIELGY